MKALSQTLGLVLGLLLLAGLWLAATTLPVRASSPCGSYEAFAARLGDKWNETVRGRGLAAGEAYVLVLFHSASGDTWTVMAVKPDGTACVLAAGSGWETVDAAPLGQEG